MMNKFAVLKFSLLILIFGFVNHAQAQEQEARHLGGQPYFNKGDSFQEATSGVWPCEVVIKRWKNQGQPQIQFLIVAYSGDINELQNAKTVGLGTSLIVNENEFTEQMQKKSFYSVSAMIDKDYQTLEVQMIRTQTQSLIDVKFRSLNTESYDTTQDFQCQVLNADSKHRPQYDRTPGVKPSPL